MTSTIILIILAAITVSCVLMTFLVVERYRQARSKLGQRIIDLSKGKHAVEEECDRLQRESTRLREKQSELIRATSRGAVEAVKAAWPIWKSIIICHVMRPRVAEWGADFVVRVHNISPYHFKLEGLHASMSVAGYVIDDGDSNYNWQMKTEAGVHVNSNQHIVMQVRFSFPEHVMAALVEQYGRNVEVKLYLRLFVVRQDGETGSVKLLLGEEDLAHLVFIKNTGDSSLLSTTGSPAAAPPPWPNNAVVLDDALEGEAAASNKQG